MSDDLADLAADLHRAADEIFSETRKVISKGALNIKGDTRDAWAWHPLFPRLFQKVSYDLTKSVGGSVSAEIGPSIGGSGSLGGIIEEGTVNNAGHHTMAIALENEVPNVEKWLTDVAGRLLDGN